MRAGGDDDTQNQQDPVIVNLVLTTAPSQPNSKKSLAADLAENPALTVTYIIIAVVGSLVLAGAVFYALYSLVLKKKKTSKVSPEDETEPKVVRA